MWFVWCLMYEMFSKVTDEGIKKKKYIILSRPQYYFAGKTSVQRLSKTVPWPGAEDGNVVTTGSVTITWTTQLIDWRSGRVWWSLTLSGRPWTGWPHSPRMARAAARGRDVAPPPPPSRPHKLRPSFHRDLRCPTDMSPVIQRRHSHSSGHRTVVSTSGTHARARCPNRWHNNIIRLTRYYNTPFIASHFHAASAKCIPIFTPVSVAHFLLLNMTSYEYFIMEFSTILFTLWAIMLFFS